MVYAILSFAGYALPHLQDLNHQGLNVADSEWTDTTSCACGHCLLNNQARNQSANTANRTIQQNDAQASTLVYDHSSSDSGSDTPREGVCLTCQLRALLKQGNTEPAIFILDVPFLGAPIPDQPELVYGSNVHASTARGPPWLA